MARISRRTHPFLFRVFDKKEIPESNAENEIDLHGIKGFNKIVKFGLPDVEIHYVSDTFLDDAAENFPKIHHLCEKIKDGKYCFLIRNDVYFLSKQGLFVEVHIASGFDIAYWGIGHINDNISFTSLYDNLRESVKEVAVTVPIAILLFKQFAETQIKFIPAKSKLKNFHCKYKNDLQFPIQLLDANWYTESIKSHPFFVRGHWRMQPHGEGKKQIKLKWIDLYKKNGIKKGAYKDA